MGTDRGQLVRLDAASVVDGAGVVFAPGTIVVEVRGEEKWHSVNSKSQNQSQSPPPNPFPLGSATLRVVAVGRPGDVDRHEASGYALRVGLGGATLIPALVNAHTHLDLTHMGPRELDARGFDGFIATVRAERKVEEAEIATSVRRGVEMSRAGGVVAVGDIGGAVRGRASLTAWRALRASGMEGVSFLEFFAAGKGWEARVGEAEDKWQVAEGRGQIQRQSPPPRPLSLGRGARIGFQPHAPYSVCLGAYRRVMALAQKCGVGVCTHLAETMSEREYVGRASGPFRALLEGLGLWDDSMLAEYGRGRRPVEHLKDVLAMGPMLAVHMNDVNDAEIEMLAASGTVTVVYCPRASDYFGAAAEFGPHRYREMMRAGVRVVLGTDSIVNLPRGTERISTLDEVMYLCERDGLKFEEALGMATWKGAEALGLDSRAFRFEVGNELAGLVAVEGGEIRWQIAEGR